MENPPVQEIHVIRDLAQLKALADPLRVRILEAFAEQPRTTKQVAARIEEKPTKLYHHVDALHKAGLIVLETTRQNRGTVEKYFRAIARLFRTDPELFGGAGGDGEAGLHAAVAESWPQVGAALLERGAEELRGSGGGAGDESGALFTSVRLTATAGELEDFRKRLEELVADFQSRSSAPAPEGEEAAPDERQYRLVLGFFPKR